MTASVQQQVFTTRRNTVHSFYFNEAQLTCTLMSRRRNSTARIEKISGVAMGRGDGHSRERPFFTNSILSPIFSYMALETCC
jgi:hypothetical protein